MLAAITLALAFPGPVEAAEVTAAEASVDVAVELRALRATIDDLVELLRRQAEAQELGLWMQRIELAARRLAPIEQERRALDADREALEQEQLQLEARMAALEEDAEADDELPLRSPDPERVNLRRELELRWRFLGEQIEARETRILALDAEISTRRHQIESWEDALDRRLAGLGR